MIHEKLYHLNDTVLQLIEDYADGILRPRYKDILSWNLGIEVLEGIAILSCESLQNIVKRNMNDTPLGDLIVALNGVFNSTDIDSLTLTTSHLFRDILNGKLIKLPQSREEILQVIEEMRRVLYQHHLEIIQDFKSSLPLPFYDD